MNTRSEDAGGREGAAVTRRGLMELAIATTVAAGVGPSAFAAVQMPLKVVDAHDGGFEKKVLPVLPQREKRFLRSWDRK